MTPAPPDFRTDSLGECTIVSPLRATRFMDTSKQLLFRADIDELRAQFLAGVDPPAFELAGPREKIYFDPSILRCGIVTCGGLCPGLNDVIRSVVFCLRKKYGVAEVYGFRFGYEGLVERSELTPVELTTRTVTQIHEFGGTVLGSSRGPQPVDEIVDTLERLEIQLLFTIGGDGTLRGAHSIVEEIRRRELKIAVVGVPKTIDNDISYIDTSFGFRYRGRGGTTRHARGVRRGVVSSLRHRPGEADGARLRLYRQLCHTGGHPSRPMPHPGNFVQHRRRRPRGQAAYRTRWLRGHNRGGRSGSKPAGRGNGT
jgi:hypothetical protein